MSVILIGIHTLKQHVRHLHTQPQEYQPQRCPSCGFHTLWAHGYYQRQADREHGSQDSLNPIRIPRYRCPHCRHTCSTLPACLPPRRWYPWSLQQQALEQSVRGHSICQIAQALIPARTTISRWIRRFKERFALHADHLRQRLSTLQRTSGFHPFWRQCLCRCSLAEAMASVHQAGIAIP